MVISPTFDFSRAISSSRSSRSRSFRAVAAPESARSRHSVSLATETFISRATSSNGSPPNNRATSANLRLTEKRFGPFPSTSEAAPSPAWGERSGAPSGLRPSTFVMSDTPVEVQFTSAGCLNYPCRTPRHGREHGRSSKNRLLMSQRKSDLGIPLPYTLAESVHTALVMKTEAFPDRYRAERISTQIFGLSLTAIFVVMLLLNAISY